MRRWLLATLAIAAATLTFSSPVADAQPSDTVAARRSHTLAASADQAKVITPQHVVSCDNKPYRPFKASSDGRIYAMGSFTCNFPPDEIYEELTLQVWNGTQKRWLNVSTRQNMTPHGGTLIRSTPGGLCVPQAPLHTFRTYTYTWGFHHNDGDRSHVSATWQTRCRLS